MSEESRPLSIEEIVQVIEQLKDELTLKGKQAARRHDIDSPFIAYGTVMAEDWLDRLIDELKLSARSGLREYLSRPPRARQIHLSPRIIRK